MNLCRTCCFVATTNLCKPEGNRMEMEKGWMEVLASVASGEPGTIKGRLLSRDKSHRFKQLSDLTAVLDKHPSPRLAIDAWLNRIDKQRQALPESAIHDLRWNGSSEVPIGSFELHMTRKR
jgi:hypothetical protein